MTRPLAIFGDSHVASFLRGVRKVGEVPLVGGGLGAASLFTKPFYRLGEDGSIDIYCQPELYERWKAATKSTGLQDFPGRLIVSLGFAAAPIYNSRTWSVFGARPRRFMSDGMLETIIADMQEPVMDFYRLLIERKMIAAVYVAPPPQKKHPRVKKYGQALVLELIRRYQAPVQRLLVDAGVPLIALAVQDSDGYMRPEFAGADDAHASAEIGPLATEALLKLGLAGDAAARVS
jgi:hypothetical protein